ncbi:hypothetical protein [Cellulomonas sp. PhB143]|uniref:hypothetical protein n=1 Tax=Cellulomonas sp. PhB143 TaxID=2485186 RepID=UPI000FA1FBE0|nr:hypothetical protein [Cellulomonas sp. PhB143]ROS76664.1 hypothetical protein EDF32_1485 [Cellulomonas sp. PhB143]
MSTPRPPRPAARVFWVRRLVALAVVVALLVVVVAAVRLALPAAGADDAAGVQPVKTAPPTPAPPGAPEACTADDVDLSVTSGATSYTPSQNPSFTVRVTHVGRTPCLVEASATGRPLVISTGGKAVYSTADCGKGERTLLLGRGDTDTQTYRWDRRTTSGGCADEHREAVGAGRYDVAASLAGVKGAASPPLEIALEPKPKAVPTADPTADPSADPSADPTADPSADPTADD